MFKAELEDISLFRDAVQTISALINEGLFKVTSNGLVLNATDPTMVAMVDFKLSKNAFRSYNYEKDENIGLNIENLNSVLKRASSGDAIIFELEEPKFSITLKGDSTRKFSLPILSMDTSVPDVQGLEFSTIVDIKSSALSTGIGDASVVGEAITFSTGENGLVLESKGDNSNVRFAIDKSNEMVLDLQGSSVKSSFSLGYLTKIMKADKLSETVKLRMGNDFPMKLEFKVPEKCELTFVLAPRIEE